MLFVGSRTFVPTKYYVPTIVMLKPAKDWPRGKLAVVHTENLIRAGTEQRDRLG